MLKVIQTNSVSTPSEIASARTYLQQFFNRKDIGFPQLPERENLWKECETLAKRLRSDFTDLVVVGIGGSSLGVRVIKEIFGISPLHFIDNVDGVDFEATMRRLPIEKTLFLFISKSGTTIETLSALEFINLEFKKIGKDLAKQSVVISENKSSSLKNWADAHHVPTLEIPLDVGGRFSVLTAVGMFPAAFFGLDIQAIRQGAKAALKAEDEICEMMVQSQKSWHRDEWIFVLWHYSNRMRFFGAWFQQLWAESLAKKLNRKGQAAARVSTPLPLVGSADQHSVLQQIMEGHKDKFVLFHRFLDAESGTNKLATSLFPETDTLVGKSLGQLLAAEAEATQEALVANGVSTMTISTEVLNEYQLGFLFMYWQLVVAGLGELLDINAFDQPGVELGKIIAKKKLAQS